MRKAFFVLNSWTGRYAAVISAVREITAVYLHSLLTTFYTVTHEDKIQKATTRGALQNSLSTNVCKDLSVWC